MNIDGVYRNRRWMQTGRLPGSRPALPLGVHFLDYQKTLLDCFHATFDTAQQRHEDLRRVPAEVRRILGPCHGAGSSRDGHSVATAQNLYDTLFAWMKWVDFVTRGCCSACASSASAASQSSSS
jgi:hypothetical protein